MVKLANLADETQASIARYCDKPEMIDKFACIVAFEPEIKRYRLDTPLTKENFLTFVGNWIESSLREYVRVEKIVEEKTGFVHVAFGNEEPEWSQFERFDAL